VGVAKEDLEDGIDLMDTDGEDAEEEDEDSEEERRVAEGFIEDAKFAAEIGLDAEVRPRHLLLLCVPCVSAFLLCLCVSGSSLSLCTAEARPTPHPFCSPVLMRCTRFVCALSRADCR
jgi:hypothetical protein